MGFVKGFFGEGFTLGIDLRDDPDDTLHVDLERCVANNLGFFNEVFSAAVMGPSSKLDSAKMKAEAQDNPGQALAQGMQEQQQEFGVAMAVAAMELPDALGRCGLGSRQADMLIDAIKAFGDGMRLTLSTPNKIGS